ncbi:MAG: TolC family protein [Bacteroidota bacterium]|nr:TolC family protein [Bacteroidota bacterium]
MKTQIVFFLILFLSFGLIAQEEIELFELYKQARQNHPLKKQSELFQEQNKLNQSVLKKNFYPQLDLNGQITYQSDVTEIDIPVPGIALPEIKKDQYKMNIDARQLIYDGGINKSAQKLEDIKLLAQITGVEVELYKLYDQLTNTFFGILLIDENTKALLENTRELDKRIETAEAAVKNGVLTRNNLDKLKAGKLRIEEKQIELKYKRRALFKTLSQLTGKDYHEEIILKLPEETNFVLLGFERPEHKLFENQKELYAEQIELQKKTRHPKVFGFGQAGYGRPGYNMFAEGFDDYYMIGMKLSWNIYDWNQSRERRNVLEIEQEIINNRKEAFDLSLNIAIENYLTGLEKINALMLNETKILKMQGEILKRTSAELDNGTITTADYLGDLNAHSQAAIRLNSFQIEKLKTQIELQILSGGVSGLQ